MAIHFVSLSVAIRGFVMPPRSTRVVVCVSAELSPSASRTSSPSASVACSFQCWTRGSGRDRKRPSRVPDGQFRIPPGGPRCSRTTGLGSDPAVPVGSTARPGSDGREFHRLPRQTAPDVHRRSSWFRRGDGRTSGNHPRPTACPEAYVRRADTRQVSIAAMHRSAGRPALPLGCRRRDFTCHWKPGGGSSA